jgi:hypothetical protein
LTADLFGRVQPAGAFDEFGGLEGIGRQFTGTQEPETIGEFIKERQELAPEVDDGDIVRGGSIQEIEEKTRQRQLEQQLEQLPEERKAAIRKFGGPINPKTQQPRLTFNLQGKVVRIGSTDFDPPITVDQAREMIGRKELDEATARQILQEAGGNKDEARKIAKRRGFKF